MFVKFCWSVSFRFSMCNSPLKTVTYCNIMAEGFRFIYILPFSLVRLRTFRLAHGLVRCNMNTGVHAHAGRMCHSEISK